MKNILCSAIPHLTTPALPLQIEAQPIVASLSLSILYKVPIIRAPEHPIG